MRKLIAITLLIIGVSLSYAADLKVLDEKENLPIPGATVFSQSGIIIGITDSEGNLNGISDRDYPLIIKCMGYNQTECLKGRSVVNLTPTAYDLQEVVVSSAERPIVRAVCYIREYISGATANDTVINYNEHMGDFFLNPKKVKGFKPSKSPRFLTSRLYARKIDNQGLDSIYRPEYRQDDFAWDMMIEFPNDMVKLSEIFNEGKTSDTIPGKSGQRAVRRLTPTLYTDQSDYLAAFKNHNLSPWLFKMMGLTIEFNELQSTWVYNNNGTGILTPADLLSGTFAMSVMCKGRWIKKAFKTDQPIRMYGYYEIYPVEIEYLTKEEAKDLKSEAPRVKMQVSPYAPPLSPAIQRIVETVRGY